MILPGPCRGITSFESLSSCEWAAPVSIYLVSSLIYYKTL